MRTQLFLSILAALVLATAGCGKKEEATPAPGATTAPAAAPAASAASR